MISLVNPAASRGECTRYAGSIRIFKPQARSLPARLRLLGHFLSALLAIVVLPEVQAGEHAVRSVSDGDTIVLQSGERVRYLGIDAPEMDDGQGKCEPLARESKDFNRRLVEGEPLRLAHDKERRDDYGRLLAYVFLKDGRMVNGLMVQEGLAVVMLKQPNTLHRDFLLACQRDAMTKRVGLWVHLPEREEIPLEGNIRSFRFHRKECASLARVPKGRRIRFRSRYEAFWAGYSPCKRCRPAVGIYPAASCGGCTRYAGSNDSKK